MHGKRNQSTFEPLSGEAFRFRCYPGIACFTKCCADLTLLLTPYDIIRMKNRLGLTSPEFLEKHTDTKLNNRARFPKVYLKMNRDADKRCPFVTKQGCAIYEDRPGACRIYPVGRAALKMDRNRETREKFFLVREEHCLGFEEDHPWTVQEWMCGEGLVEYNAANDRWLEILSNNAQLGAGKDVAQKIQMFSMASYNIDTFRAFIFESRFLQLFEVDSHVKEKIACDDLALLDFAVDWLKFSLFNEKTMRMRGQTPAS